MEKLCPLLVYLLCSVQTWNIFARATFLRCMFASALATVAEHEGSVTEAMFTVLDLKLTPDHDQAGRAAGVSVVGQLEP